MILILAYLSAIVLANLSVAAFGPSVSIVNAFVLIGLDLSARDSLHDLWRGRALWPRMAMLIAAGSGLSWLLNRQAGAIALASGLAFLSAGLVDAISYQLLGEHARLIRVNGSNILSAAADSLIFPALAFGLPLLWTIVIGQFAAKVAGGFLWSLVLNRPGGGRAYCVAVGCTRYRMYRSLYCLYHMAHAEERIRHG